MEALEERRRRLYDTPSGPLNCKDSLSQAIARINAAPEPESPGNPCGRRLDGTNLSDEERRRLGVTACVDFQGGSATAFSVSLGLSWLRHQRCRTLTCSNSKLN